MAVCYVDDSLSARIKVGGHCNRTVGLQVSAQPSLNIGLRCAFVNQGLITVCKVIG